MMKVIFRRAAEADLRGIVEWYEGVAPEVVENILSDIFRSIDQLTDFPRSGSKFPRQRFRRLVTRKYQFKIAYEIGDDTISIVGIYRYQNRDH
jgi:plasmid stabilization system protein ParE